MRKKIIFLLITLLVIATSNIYGQQPKSIQEIMALADEYGNTDEEKYGNAVYLSMQLAMNTLNDLATSMTTLVNNNSSNQETFDEAKKIGLKAKKNIKSIKTCLEVRDVPEGYKDVHDDIILYYDELISSTDMLIKGVENKSSDDVATGLEKLGNSTSILQKAVNNLKATGYKLSPEFNNVTKSIFKK